MIMGRVTAGIGCPDVNVKPDKRPLSGLNDAPSQATARRHKADAAKADKHTAAISDMSSTSECPRCWRYQTLTEFRAVSELVI